MVGTLSAQIAIGTGLDAPFGGGSMLAAEIIERYAVAAGLTGAGALDAASALPRFSRNAALNGGSNLAALPKPIYTSAANLAGVGALSATAEVRSIAWEASSQAINTTRATRTVSTTHTSGGGASTVVIVALLQATTLLGRDDVLVSSVTYGGVPMVPLVTCLPTYYYSTGSSGPDGRTNGVHVYTLFNPPAGPQTVSVTWPDDVSTKILTVNSYTNVASVGCPTVAPAQANSTANSVTAPTRTANDRVVFVHGLAPANTNTTNITGHNQTVRQNLVGVASGTNQAKLLVADAPGGGDVTGTVTLSFSNGSIASRDVAIRLSPVAGTPIKLVSTGYINGTTMTLPAHQPGDMIVLAAMAGSTIMPSKASAGNWLDTPGVTTITGGSNSMRTCYKFATSVAEACGTWTSAAYLLVAVYRGATGFGQYASLGATTGYELIFEALTPGQLDDTSRLLGFGIQTVPVRGPRFGWPRAGGNYLESENGEDGACLVCDSAGGVIAPSIRMSIRGDDTGKWLSHIREIVGV